MVAFQETYLNSICEIGSLLNPPHFPHSNHIVFPEWWGLNQSIQKTTDYIASQGFRALAVDL